MNKKKKYWLLFLITFCFSCSEPKKVDKFKDPDLINLVGDLVPDSTLDGDFKECYPNYILQYYAFKEKPFSRGKLSFKNFVNQQYKIPEKSDESGLLRIRFIVNCKGESGRFRLLGMNENYQEKKFDKYISDQLLNLTRDYNDWRILKHKNKPRDYYFYVTFKINQGKIIEILP